MHVIKDNKRARSDTLTAEYDVRPKAKTTEGEKAELNLVAVDVISSWQQLRRVQPPVSVTLLDEVHADILEEVWTYDKELRLYMTYNTTIVVKEKAISMLGLSRPEVTTNILENIRFLKPFSIPQDRLGQNNNNNINGGRQRWNGWCRAVRSQSHHYSQSTMKAKRCAKRPQRQLLWMLERTVLSWQSTMCSVIQPLKTGKVRGNVAHAIVNQLINTYLSIDTRAATNDYFHKRLIWPIFFRLIK